MQSESPDGPLQTLKQRVGTWVWDVDPRTLSAPRRASVVALRLAYAIWRDWGGLNLRAMSLVYTTLLATVPLLAVSFSVLKAFGVHNQVEPLLYNFLEPLGPKGSELGRDVVGFVENVRVGVLGSIGLALLIYTVVSLLKKIEEAFNFVWRIESMRSFAHRFSSYLSVVLIGPVLAFSALGITASVMSTAIVQRLLSFEPVGTLTVFAGKLVPYLLVWIAFKFIYVFVPNTRVQVRAAALGALVAALIWQTTGWGFAAFIASSAKYAAIYSSFAILILLLIWLYLNWLILLLGAQIAFYIQNPQYLTIRPVRLVLSNRLKERLALGIMFLVAQTHHHQRRPWTLQRLVDRLELPTQPVQNLLEMLERHGWLVATADDPPGYLPGRDIATIDVAGLIGSVRRADESGVLGQDRVTVDEPVAEILDRAQLELERTLGGTTLAGLVLEAERLRPTGSVHEYRNDGGRSRRDRR